LLTLSGFKIAHFVPLWLALMLSFRRGKKNAFFGDDFWAQLTEFWFPGGSQSFFLCFSVNFY
jgi:hypothetical protein